MQSFKLGISALVLASLCVALSAREVSYQNTSVANAVIKNISKRMEALSAWQSNNYFFK
ncbi:hypothetical protein NHP200010_13930 [Helicobacter bizzozeronii]|uniref:hypothetical protein n=1 Tax=Helicobacter bizzozeronii TaxID=56877 RepID=UPI00244D8B36|nr:hypothetical protein [Helicobacter bizzozeronii]GMB93666.1 hypothetical protein NHP200010_13930 [Helicobacter bizzozeronii]